MTDAGGGAIREGMEWLERSVTDEDLGMLFLAGHGLNDNSGDYYFLPVDTQLDDLQSTAISHEKIKNTLTNMAGPGLLFLDTCYSGNILGKTVLRGGPVDINGVANDLGAAENGIIVFAASSSRQFSQENSAWGNGAFTKVLVEALTGKADYEHEGQIRISSLNAYLSRHVEALTNGAQTPVFVKPNAIKDFAVAKYKG